LEGACEGLLCIKGAWPGMLRSIYGDHKRFIETYFIAVKQSEARSVNTHEVQKIYFTGDGCKRDEDGYYWITGRIDDVLNVSGHRLGTAEIESALVAHPDVAEAAVVGYPHDIKGQGIYAYVTLNAGVEPNRTLQEELVAQVRKDIGPIAKPDFLHWTPALPKTRSGKIMRRILRKIAENNYDNLGDISTLLNPEVVDELIKTRHNKG
jgi:acetyl-CoA synthetase